MTAATPCAGCQEAVHLIRQGVGAEDNAIQLFHLARKSQRVERGAFIAVVNQFQTALAALADAADLSVGQGGMAAIDMADNVRVGFEHDIRVDQPGARNGRAAGVDRAVHAVLARPRTIFRAVGPSLTLPRPTSPSQRTPAVAISLKSSSVMPCSITGAPA
jgi:hypothetical protein